VGGVGAYTSLCAPRSSGCKLLEVYKFCRQPLSSILHWVCQPTDSGVVTHHLLCRHQTILKAKNDAGAMRTEGQGSDQPQRLRITTVNRLAALAAGGLLLLKQSYSVLVAPKCIASTVAWDAADARHTA
jgi:hypothetical protein